MFSYNNNKISVIVFSLLISFSHNAFAFISFFQEPPNLVQSLPLGPYIPEPEIPFLPVPVVELPVALPAPLPMPTSIPSDLGLPNIPVELPTGGLPQLPMPDDFVPQEGGTITSLPGIPFSPSDLIETTLIVLQTGDFARFGDLIINPATTAPYIEPSPERAWRIPDGSLPEIPAINREVIGIKGGIHTRPLIPPFRPNSDGRLVVDSQGAGGGVALYLYNPEKIKENFLDSRPGINIVSDPKEWYLPLSELIGKKAGEPGYSAVQHTNICEPYTNEYLKKRNPYTCGKDGKDDCYDVTIVSAMNGGAPVGEIPIPIGPFANAEGTGAFGSESYLATTPITVQIENPKTVDAKIVDVKYGKAKFTPKPVSILFETITPKDGRLLVARRGPSGLQWLNENTGLTETGVYDIVYAVAPEDAPPCDASYWADIKPITHAPYDANMNQRYMFAKTPFRDPMGNVIRDGEDLKGTYPWVDKEAKNLSFLVSSARLYPTYFADGNPRSRYPARCVDGVADCTMDTRQDSSPLFIDNMVAIMGGWTQGKMILMDGLINNVDFMLGVQDKHHSLISIYEPGYGANGFDKGEKRVGVTRGGHGGEMVDHDNDGVYDPFDIRNISMFDSIENRFNFLESLKPAKNRDVVWNVSKGHITEEFAFDDYLNPDAFIVSNMVMSMSWNNYHPLWLTRYDGWHHEDLDFTGQVRVQNSAASTTDRWLIPSFGQVVNSRMEPVANGGVHGKGLWLNGNHAFVAYPVPEQKDSYKVYETPWFSSIFIDPRFDNDGEERVIIEYPDHSKLTITGRHTLNYRHPQQGVVHSIALPNQGIASEAWTHIAIQSRDEHSEFTLYLNGLPYDHWYSDLDGLFQMEAGQLNLGDTTTSGNFANILSPRNVLTNSVASSIETIINPFGELAEKAEVVFDFPVVGGVSNQSGLNLKPFRGWIDEFKVFAYELDVETACNQANGTLIGYGEFYQGPDMGQMDYPAHARETISESLAARGKSTFANYACFHDYARDDKAHLKNTPQSAKSLRADIHFPEGPLFHNAPRPDSSQNEFCLSCHHKNGLEGLNLEALEYRGDVLAKNDLRRQPSQPARFVSGNIPANWLSGSPSQSLQTPDYGILLDEWVLEESSQTYYPPLTQAIVEEETPKEIKDKKDKKKKDKKKKDKKTKDKKKKK